MTITTITGTTSGYVFGQAKHMELIGYRPLKLVRNDGIWVLRMGR